MVIRFRTERDDPRNPGKTIPGELAEYYYPKTVNWRDTESLERLNKWRNQIFLRSFGSNRDTRHPWLEIERDALFELLREHLLTPEVSGRWLKINWKHIAEDFNKRFAGTIQKAGSMTAGRRYRTKNMKSSEWDVISPSHPLPTDRDAPIRTHGSLRSQIENFSHPTGIEIVEEAKRKDAAARRLESGEIPDSKVEEEASAGRAGFEGDEAKEEVTDVEMGDADDERGFSGEI